MPPESAEEEVDHHFVCLVKSHTDGHVYELDGDKPGPVDIGEMGEDDDLLCEKAVQVVRRYMVEDRNNLEFALLALVPA